MTKYVAFLRGINVGGKSKVPMSELKKLFDELGFQNVRTYINSGNVIFEAFKIRTMHEGADQLGSRYEQGHIFHDEDDPRVTRVGQWLRRHDFDEIKNLTNVRRGEMSLVGPRAATPGDEVILQTTLTVDEYRERRQWFEDGKPGVFNAPIAFARDTMKDRDDKLGHEWNRYYAENASVGLDVYIIYKTFSTRLHAKAEKLVNRVRRAA